MSESQGALKPISPTRVAEELKRLRQQRAAGELDHDEYEHRFARMIGELRDRRIDGTRAEIMAVLGPLRGSGIDAADFDRLTKQLGLA